MSEIVTQNDEAIAQHDFLREPKGKFDRFSAWLADRSSPLLVKETRQAIKSRQFFYTFLALLLAMVIWSYLGVSNSIVTGNSASGMEQLIGYLWILAFPLHIIIPFSAFRSIMREFEDDTLQLVSITSLSSRGIVYGKLGSALLQMIVYLAALVPGIAFSYLLRGVDLIQIVSMIMLLVTSSFGLTTIGLLIGSIGRQFFLRIFAHLVLLAILAGSYLGFCTAVTEYFSFMNEEIPWQVLYFMVSVTLTAALLSLETSVSAISFYAENRSTNVRLAIILVTFALVSGLMVLSGVDGGGARREFFFVFSAFVAHLYVVFGAMMASEYPIISQRVRRGIPSTFGGQSIWGLLLPGPGRGYLFAISMIWGWIGGLLLIEPVFNWLSGTPANGGTPADWQMKILFGLTNAVFATLFVSIAYLVGRALNTRIPKPAPFFGLLLVVVLYVLVWAFSAILTTMANEYLWDYSNPNQWEANWTNFYCWPLMLNAVMYRTPSIETYVYLGFDVGVMLILGAISLMLASREIALPQAMVPKRVLEERKNRRRVVATHVEETVEDLFQKRAESIAGASTLGNRRSN